MGPHALSGCKKRNLAWPAFSVAIFPANSSPFFATNAAVLSTMLRTSGGG
jgi:hypothetical protein